MTGKGNVMNDLQTVYEADKSHAEISKSGECFLLHLYGGEGFTSLDHYRVITYQEKFCTYHFQPSL